MHSLNLNAPTAILLDQFEALSKDLGILQVSDAPTEELTTAQHKVDRVKEELMRRMAW